MKRAVVIDVAAMPPTISSVIFAAETRLDGELVCSTVALSIRLRLARLP
ncbi:MAG: hypothetical protein P0121_03950 [Nitrospira sp.]|nr:hypothetical protein [Nitrospira sp.]